MQDLNELFGLETDTAKMDEAVRQGWLARIAQIEQQMHNGAGLSDEDRAEYERLQAMRFA